jgi:2,4-dienoyl-CoA reductase-like NADH-dependent reductase (Old Yellow Enzyme family)
MNLLRCHKCNAGMVVNFVLPIEEIPAKSPGIWTMTAAQTDIPLLWKINFDDFLDGGMGMDAYAEAAAALCAAGVDMIEISGGIKDQIKLRTRLMKEAGDWEAYFHQAIKPFRKAVGKKALTLTGGIRSQRAMEHLLDQGVDYVGMCRPLISEPDLPNRLLLTPDRREARCTSCNKCLIRIATRPLRCVEFDSLTAVLKQL